MIEIWSRKTFLIAANFCILAIYALSRFWPAVGWAYLIALPLIAIGFVDCFQTRHALLRNYPIIGRMRYFLESLRPEIRQYFIESDADEIPFSREMRSVVYQRAKGELDTLPFGTRMDVNRVGYEWISHSLKPVHPAKDSDKVLIGQHNCKQPYQASLFNISAMSYGSLSKNAILALNKGAKVGGFYHNTGEGGLSPYHLENGGDLLWQIGTGYFGCRNLDGSFCAEKFQVRAALPNVKMIEIKLSQGAKPAHGGILPKAKLTAEISQIRGVPMGQDVISPPSHTAFESPVGLLEFVAHLRELSGGKPVGFKLCIGNEQDFFAICKAMIKTGITPDFITVDGADEIGDAQKAIAPSTISVVGYTTHLRELIQSAGGAIAAGRSALECLALEVPVVLLGEGGVLGLCHPSTWARALATNLGDHIYPKEFNPSALEFALRELLASSKLPDLKRWGRTQVEKDFNIDSIAKKIEAVYDLAKKSS